MRPIVAAAAGARGVIRSRARAQRPPASSARNSASSAYVASQHANPVRAQERAELKEIRTVGLQRVAREAALELEVRDEVEDQRLDAAIGYGRAGSLRDGCRLCDVHRCNFAAPARAP